MQAKPFVRIAQAQAIAIDEDYFAQHSQVIEARPPWLLGENGLELSPLRPSQPEKITY